MYYVYMCVYIYIRAVKTTIIYYLYYLMKGYNFKKRLFF